MYKQETIKPYSAVGDKTGQVEQMFNQIAPTYDTLNHRLSWNIDRSWRRKALRQLAPYSPKSILDVATGTGDFALMAARMLRPDSVVGIDISDGMMEVARQKASDAGLDGIVSFAHDDCLALSFGDNSFDAVTAAFGIRNFEHLDKGLAEMWRVLKRGGCLSVVELTTPVSFPMKQLFAAYSHTVLPLYGRLVSGDSKAYSYLTRTIEAFPQGETMTAALLEAGFEKASFRRLTFGICTMYFAIK